MAHLRSWRYPPLGQFHVFGLWLVGRHSDVFHSHTGKVQQFVHSGGAVSRHRFLEFCLRRKGLQTRGRSGDGLGLVLLPLAQLAKDWGWLRLRFEVYVIKKIKVIINSLAQDFETLHLISVHISDRDRTT